MNIKVYVDKGNKEQTINVTTISEIFKKLNLSMDSFIIVRNNELITEHATLREGDTIRLLSVISGG